MAAKPSRRAEGGEGSDAHRHRSVDGPHAREIRERLSRASGQLRGIEGMYDSGRWCTEVLDQIAGVRRALDGVAMLLVEDHVSGCLAHETHSPADVEELLSVVRRYIRSV